MQIHTGKYLQCVQDMCEKLMKAYGYFSPNIHAQNTVNDENIQ